MPTPCLFGSEKAPGAPDFFAFTDADLFAAMGSWSSEVSLELLGISIRPQNTAEFAANPPNYEFPDPLDYAKLAAPPLAMISGTYTRFANLVKATKWATLAVCIQPSPVPGAQVTACQPAGRTAFITAKIGTIPAGATLGHIRLRAWSPGPADWPTGGSSFEPGAFLNTSPDIDIDSNGGGTSTWSEAFSSFGETLTFTPATYLDAEQTLYITSPVVSVPGHCWRVSWDFTPAGDSPTPPPPPPLEPPPAGFPAAVDACSSADMASLCRKLDAMDARIQHISTQLVPVAPQTYAPPIPAVPILPLPTDGSAPAYEPIPKPEGAVGAIISCPTVPASQPHYGHDPEFWPSLGHACMITTIGPLASVLIRHRPLVILPVPPQVISIVLDLAPGVAGAVQWLRSPK